MIQFLNMRFALNTLHGKKKFCLVFQYLLQNNKDDTKFRFLGNIFGTYSNLKVSASKTFDRRQK